MQNKLTSLAFITVLLGASTPLTVLADNMAMAGKLNVTAKFNPAPPKQGSETILVSLKDAKGKPVKGARVKVASTMPSMSMSGPSMTAHDNGDGTYSAKTKINFATKWTFDVSASAGKQKGAAHLSADVK